MIGYGSIAICVGEKDAIGMMSCADIAVTESAECRRRPIGGVRHEAVGFARHLIHGRRVFVEVVVQRALG